MKYNRVFRILALAVIFSLLMIAIPATPALAASIELGTTRGKIGTYVSIIGEDFPPSNFAVVPPIEKYVDIYFSRESADEDEYIDDNVLNYEEKTGVLVDEDGSFNTSFQLPNKLTDGYEVEDVKAGTYYFYVTYGGSKLIRARATFTVIFPAISLSPAEGVVGTKAKITGTDFAAEEDIAITYDGKDITDKISSGEPVTDEDGGFTCTVPIPKSTAGYHTLATVIDTEKSQTKFKVKPGIATTPASGVIGDSVTVTGTGFGGGVDVTIDFGTMPGYAKATTDEYGSFTTSFNVPVVVPGNIEVKAKDEDDNTATVQFTITTSISLSPVTSVASPGYVSMEITITGTGFKPNTQITITYTSEPIVVATPTSDAKGAFSATFKVPPSPAGAHTIKASDGTSTLQATFIMESTAPAIPPPKLPFMGGKAKSKAYFDWEDVTKDANGADEKSTPVTYTLQIASDADFKTILVEKTKLTTSEYTLTSAEKLKSTKKEAPYYWRIRAVDAASNASAWSGAGTFYVGFTFGFPELEGPVLYGVIGAGVLLLFFLGFWAGRKSKGTPEYY